MAYIAYLSLLCLFPLQQISLFPLSPVHRRTDLPQLFNRHLGVDLRRGQITVAQHGLDKADIRPIAQHVGRHRVAEQVADAGFVDAGSVEVFFHHFTQGVMAHGSP